MADLKEATVILDPASIAERHFGENGVEVSICNDEGVKYITTWRKMGEYIKAGKFPTPCKITYEIHRRQYEDKVFTDLKLQTIEGFDASKGGGGGKGGWKQEDPGLKARSMAISYAKDIMVAAIAAGTIKITPQNWAKVPERLLEVAKPIAAFNEGPKATQATTQAPQATSQGQADGPALKPSQMDEPPEDYDPTRDPNIPPGADF